MAPRVQALGVAAKAVLEARARPGDEPSGDIVMSPMMMVMTMPAPRGVRTHRGNIDQVVILASFKAELGEKRVRVRQLCPGSGMAGEPNHGQIRRLTR